MADKQMIEKYQKFVDSISFEELFNYIRNITGLKDLKFTITQKEDRFGYPRIEFKSQDLIEKVGFLKVIFSNIYICNFNSEIRYNSENDSFFYWCTVSIDYTHPGGGSNGKTFLTARYKANNWTIDNYSD